MKNTAGLFNCNLLANSQQCGECEVVSAVITYSIYKENIAYQVILDHSLILDCSTRLSQLRQCANV